MDSQQFQECLFYLRTYGSYLSVIDFHRRHGYYMKAVQYILDHVSTVELQWLKYWWLVYHGCFQLVFESFGKKSHSCRFGTM